MDPQISGLRYRPEYLGLFQTNAAHASGLFLSAPRHPGREVTVFEAVGQTLAVVTGNTHADPVCELLTEWHEKVTGGSFLAVAFSRSATPPPEDSFVFRIPMDLMTVALLRAIQSSEYVLAIHSISEGAAWLFCRNATDAFLGSEAPGGVTQRRYAFAGHIPRLAAVKGRSAGYDPIGSRISELLNQTLPALGENVQMLKRKWNKDIGGRLPPDIASLTKTIESATGEVRNDLTDDSGDDMLDRLEQRILWTGLWAHTNINQSQRLCSQLEDHRSGLDPMGQHKTFLEAGGSVLLRAAGALGQELLRRLSRGEKYDLFAVFGREVSVQQGIFFRSSDGGEKPTREIQLLSIPHTFRLRLGALPAIAHPIAHLWSSSAAWKLVTESARERHSGFAVDVLRQVAPDLGRTSFQDLPLEKEVELVEKQLRPAQRWADEIVADLLACAVCGPAYLFSLARFTSYPVSSVRKSAKTAGEFPPIRDRISLCHSFFKTSGIEVPFHSRFMPDPVAADLGVLREEILGAVAKPYTGQEHAAATGNVKAALMRGQMVDVEPTQVLNAIWDGVVRKSGYVNEFSALTSIATRLGEWIS
jgi:hypothetical protein